MNTGFNDFTNLSSVTKTLCNRLIPTEITAKYIKEHGVIEADQERNMMSQELKNILNDFYRRLRLMTCLQNISVRFIFSKSFEISSLILIFKSSIFFTLSLAWH